MPHVRFGNSRGCRRLHNGDVYKINDLDASRVRDPRSGRGPADAFTIGMIDHTQDITDRDKASKRSLLPFALLIVVALIIWLAFTHYL